MGRFTTSPSPPEDKPAGDFQKAETSSDANAKVGPASISDKSGDGNYKWASTTATDRNFGEPTRVPFAAWSCEVTELIFSRRGHRELPCQLDQYRRNK